MSYTFNHIRRETFLDYLIRHKEWGFHTFGSPDEGRDSRGPLDHLKKEIVEIEKSDEASAAMEWIDLIILSFDGLLRSQIPGDKQSMANVMTAAASMCPPPMLAGQVIMPVSNLDAVKRVVTALDADPLNPAGWIRLCATVICAFTADYDVRTMLGLMFEKQEKNGRRIWPDWRNVPVGQAIEHVKGVHD